MNILLNARNMAEPTADSIKKYSVKKFSRLLNKFKFPGNVDVNVKLNVDFNPKKKLFVLKIILRLNGNVFVFEVVDKDPRKAIDASISNLHNQIRKYREKRFLNYH